MSRFVRSVALGVLVAVAACGGDTSDGAENSQVDELLVAAEAAGSDQQVAIMEDGVVTDEELLDAVLAARSCVADLGMSVSSISRQWDGDLSYSFSASDDGLVAAADRCQEDHAVLVQQAYNLLNPANIAPVVSRFNACTGELGLEPISAESRDDLRRVAQQSEDEAVLECYTAAFPSTVVAD